MAANKCRCGCLKTPVAGYAYYIGHELSNSTLRTAAEKLRESNTLKRFNPRRAEAFKVIGKFLDGLGAPYQRDVPLGEIGGSATVMVSQTHPERISFLVDGRFAIKVAGPEFEGEQGVINRSDIELQATVRGIPLLWLAIDEVLENTAEAELKIMALLEGLGLVEVADGVVGGAVAAIIENREGPEK